MLKQVSAVALASLASLALGLAPLAAAQAAPARAKALPNPCKTFTLKSAHAALAVSPGVRLTEKLTGASHPVRFRACTIKHGKVSLSVTVAWREGGQGMDEKCYQRPKLGHAGAVCVSLPRTPAFSFAEFRKDNVWVFDGITAMLPHQGRRIFDFALAQSKSFKG
jgi:hypothetical protein